MHIYRSTSLLGLVRNQLTKTSFMLPPKLTSLAPGSYTQKGVAMMMDSQYRDLPRIRPPLLSLDPPSKSQSSVKYLDPPVPSTTSLLVVWE